MIYKEDLQVIIPMAGLGKRFSDRGYTISKPLIPINGKPMIERVVENLGITKNLTFLIQGEILEDGFLESLLREICQSPRIISLDRLTEGPLSTTLLAREFISRSPLMIINCDQIIQDFNL
ncbi:MAG: glycosyl transferase family 2, partial [Flavobacteriaceae bacterium]|nr:glycosyl transferase family 2 [Flavobacteriaceae bacterium]